MKKKFLYVIFGLVISLIGFSVNWYFKSEKKDTWEQQIESQESITTMSQTYIPKEFDWVDEDISATLFQLMPEKFLFASGTGAWSTVLFLKDDGSFTGRYHDSDTNTVYICEFTGAFTMPIKIDDYIYSVHIKSLEYPEVGQEYDKDDIHYITSEPYGLKNVDEILIYIPGYSISELSQEARGWLYGSSRVFWKPITPKILSFFTLYNVNDKEAFSSEPLWESTIQVQLLENQYCDERFFKESMSESELIYYVVNIENVSQYSFSFMINKVAMKTGEVTEIIRDTAYFIEDGKKASNVGVNKLYFWFGDDPYNSTIESLTITGMEELENIKYLNTGIPVQKEN